MQLDFQRPARFRSATRIPYSLVRYRQRRRSERDCSTMFAGPRNAKKMRALRRLRTWTIQVTDVQFISKPDGGTICPQLDHVLGHRNGAARHVPWRKNMMRSWAHGVHVHDQQLDGRRQTAATRRRDGCLRARRLPLRLVLTVADTTAPVITMCAPNQSASAGMNCTAPGAGLQRQA